MFSANEDGLSAQHILPDFPQHIPCRDDFLLEERDDLSEEDKAKIKIDREIYFLEFINNFLQPTTAK